MTAAFQEYARTGDTATAPTTLEDLQEQLTALRHACCHPMLVKRDTAALPQLTLEGAAGADGQGLDHGVKLTAVMLEIAAMRQRDKQAKCIILSSWPP